jgi:luciferase family oxidoreductase group 1
MVRGVALSVLDQSPVLSGGTAADAIAATIELAVAADRLGFKRYWLAEHHGLPGLADPCPEILLARIAAATRSIRVGTGGIMLPYYSAFKVAEVFRMLETLYPGRIDLGVGRAPGGDQRTARAMTGGEYRGAPDFPVQVQEVLGHLTGALPAGHPYHDVLVQPAGAGMPEFWMLGSSDYGGALAAALGLRFTFAHFITAQGGETVTRAYREHFRAGLALPAPHVMVAVFVVCAETDVEAERLATSIDLRRLQMDQGINGPIPTLAEAASYPYTDADRIRIRHHRQRAVIGSPERVRVQLLEMQERFGADELVVVTITGDYASRLRSYELLAATFDLACPPSRPAGA